MDGKLVWITQEQRGLLSTFATHTPESQRVGTVLALAFDAAPEPAEVYHCEVCGWVGENDPETGLRHTAPGASWACASDPQLWGYLVPAPPRECS